MPLTMINLTKFLYHILLLSLSILLVQCGGQENSGENDLPSNDGFTCDGGREIKVQYVNDGHCDCEDGTDERDPCDDIAEEPSFTPNAYCTGDKVNMRKNPELRDGNVIQTLTENQNVVVVDEYKCTDRNAGVMKKTYEWYAWDSGLEEGPTKLRKNHAVQIVKDPSSVLDVPHADKSLDLVDLIYLPEDKLFYGVPKSYISSTYGEIWYKVETEGGEEGWVYGDFIEFE